MKKRNFCRVLGVCAVVLSLAVVAASSPLFQEDKGAVPIVFKWKKAVFEKDIAAMIQDANAMLAGVLGELRRNPQSVTVEKLNSMFKGTYLRKPVIWLDSQNKAADWEIALPKLKEIVDKSDFINIQDVCVELEYQPHVKGTPAENDTDVVAHIRARLACSPKNDPIIEGYLTHRRVCFTVAGD